MTVFGPEGIPTESRLCEPGEPLTFHVPSPYLISAGQAVDIGVSVFDADWIVGQQHSLIDATHLRDDELDSPLVDVPVVWDVSFLPTRRLLADILEDVVQHGINNPEHGVNCSCMDAAAREIRLQVSKALPPDGRTTDSDWSQPIRDRVMSKARIKHVLNMVLRGL